jgi:hypothetical protein
MEIKRLMCTLFFEDEKGICLSNFIEALAAIMNRCTFKVHNF